MRTGISRFTVAAVAALAAALGCAALAAAPPQHQRADIIWYSLTPASGTGTADAPTADASSLDGTTS